MPASPLWRCGCQDLLCCCAGSDTVLLGRRRWNRDLQRYILLTPRCRTMRIAGADFRLPFCLVYNPDGADLPRRCYLHAQPTTVTRAPPGRADVRAFAAFRLLRAFAVCVARCSLYADMPGVSLRIMHAACTLLCNRLQGIRHPLSAKVTRV